MDPSLNVCLWCEQTVAPDAVYCNPTCLTKDAQKTLSRDALLLCRVCCLLQA